MEKRGIRTERGDLNREIEVTNQKLRQLKARISKLQDWLKEEQENTEPPTLADYIQGILSRRAREGKSQVSQSIYNLKDAAKMLNFLQANNIMDMAGLDEKFKSMIGEQLDIQHKLKPIDRRLGTLKKHIEQAEIYFKYKGEKEADRSRANPVYGSERLSKRRDERQDHNPDKGMESGVCQADRRTGNAQPAVSCFERGSERSRANPQERLQHLAAGTAGAAQPRRAQDGAVTHGAVG